MSGHGVSQFLKHKRSTHIRRVLPFVWIAVLGWIAFFNHLGSIGLVDETEPLFVEAARQMTVTGNWITPYFNGVTRFDKPPLIYWLMAIAFETIGVNEWAARIPSALAGTVLTGFCFYALKRSTTSIIAPYLGAAIASLNLMTLFFGRLGYSDMLLSVCFGGSLLSFFLGYIESKPNKTRWYFSFYGLMALAVLTKGPVGAVLPSAIVLIFLLWSGNLREELRAMKLVWGIGLFLLVCVPWYVLAYIQNGDAFINSFFGVHNVERFTTVVNQHSGAWYYHFVLVLFGFFPWSLCLPAAIAFVFSQSQWRQQPRSQHLGWFALIWFSVVLGFFTIAVTKYISYSLPSLPAAAILVALWWDVQRFQPGQSKWLKFSVYTTIAAAVAVAIGILYSPNWISRDPAMPTLGLRAQQAGLPITGAIVWFGVAIAGVVLALRRQLRWFWIVNLAAIAALIVFFITPMIGILDLERQLPLRQIAQATVQNQKPGESIVMATRSFEKPSLVFYTRRSITFFHRARFIQPYLQTLRQKGTEASILMITTPDTIEEAEMKPNQFQFIQQTGVYQLVRVPIAKH